MKYNYLEVADMFNFKMTEGSTTYVKLEDVFTHINNGVFTVDVNLLNKFKNETRMVK